MGYTKILFEDEERAKVLAGVADLSPRDHLEMQAALQPYVDGAISKTVNAPEACGLEAIHDLFRRADEAGLKGFALFRPNRLRGEVLSAGCDRPPGGRA